MSNLRPTCSSIALLLLDVARQFIQRRLAGLEGGPGVAPAGQAAAVPPVRTTDRESRDAIFEIGVDVREQRLEVQRLVEAAQLLEQVENLDRQVRGFEHQMQTVFSLRPPSSYS
jgi:hypothetical protein